MPRSIRVVPVLLVLAALAWTVSLGTVAEPAHADRCQPEELVLGSGNSPLGSDSGDPRCPIMQAVVYDTVTCDDSTFMRCVNTLCLVGNDWIGCQVTVNEFIDRLRPTS